MAPRPQGAGPPPGVGGAGQAGPVAPAPQQPQGETRGEGARAGRAGTTPQAWGQRSPEPGSVPRGDTGHWSRSRWHDDHGRLYLCLPGDGGRPPQQHGLPRALQSPAVTAKPRRPRHGGSSGSSSLQHADFLLLILLAGRLFQRLWHRRHILGSHHLLPQLHQQVTALAGWQVA